MIGTWLLPPQGSGICELGRWHQMGRSWPGVAGAFWAKLAGLISRALNWIQWRKGDVVLSDREEAGNTNTLGSSREILENCPKGNTEGSSKKVMWLRAQLKCLYTSMQLGKQARGVERHSAIRKLWANCYHRNMVGLITQLEYCSRGLQTFHKRQAGKEGWWRCPLRWRINILWRAASEKKLQTGWEPKGKHQGPDQ